VISVFYFLYLLLILAQGRTEVMRFSFHGENHFNSLSLLSNFGADDEPSDSKKEQQAAARRAATNQQSDSNFLPRSDEDGAKSVLTSASSSSSAAAAAAQTAAGLFREIEAKVAILSAQRYSKLNDESNRGFEEDEPTRDVLGQDASKPQWQSVGGRDSGKVVFNGAPIAKQLKLELNAATSGRSPPPPRPTSSQLTAKYRANLNQLFKNHSVVCSQYRKANDPYFGELDVLFLFHYEPFGCETREKHFKNPTFAFEFGRLHRALGVDNITQVASVMNLWWFKADSRANQHGNKLGEGDEFEAMRDEWFMLQAQLIRCFYPQLLVTFQADVHDFAASHLPKIGVPHSNAPYIIRVPISSVSPSPGWSPPTVASMIVVPQYHHSSIVQAHGGVAQIKRGLLKDFAASVVLCLLSPEQTHQFATVHDARMGSKVATACGAGTNDFWTGVYIATCERTCRPHGLGIESVDEARMFYEACIRKHHTTVPLNASFVQLTALLSSIGAYESNKPGIDPITGEELSGAGSKDDGSRKMPNKERGKITSVRFAL